MSEKRGLSLREFFTDYSWWTGEHKVPLNESYRDEKKKILDDYGSGFGGVYCITQTKDDKIYGNYILIEPKN